MKLKLSAFIILLLGFTMFAASRLTAQKITPSEQAQQKSFVIHYLVSRSLDNGTLEPYEYRVKYVHSTGNWKESRYSFNGKVTTWVASGDGLYEANKNSLQYYGKHDAEMIKYPNASKEAIMASPQFSRIERVAGLEAYVLKLTGSQSETETYVSVETGKTPLKILSKLKQNGKESVQLVEVTSVEFKEFSDADFQLPNLPVGFDVAEQKVKSLKQAGQNELADRLQQAINKLKANTNT